MNDYFDRFRSELIGSEETRQKIVRRRRTVVLIVCVLLVGLGSLFPLSERRTSVVAANEQLESAVVEAAAESSDSVDESIAVNESTGRDDLLLAFAAAPDDRRFRTSATWSEDGVFILGGVGGEAEEGVAGYSFSLVNPGWNPIEADARADRSEHLSVWAGDKVVILGGYNDAEFNSTAAAYDPVSRRWEDLPPIPLMSTSAAENALSWFDSALWLVDGPAGQVHRLGAGEADWETSSLDGEIAIDPVFVPTEQFLFLVSSGSADRIVVLEAGTSEWRSVASPPQYAGELDVLRSSNVVGLPNSRLLLWAADPTLFFDYDPVEGLWTAGEPLGLPSCEGSASPLLFEDELWIYTSCGSPGEARQYSLSDQTLESSVIVAIDRGWSNSARISESILLDPFAGTDDLSVFSPEAVSISQ